MFYDSTFIQILMGGTAALTFLRALNLLSAAGDYLRAKASKIKAETAMLIATTRRIRSGKNGDRPDD